VYLVGERGVKYRKHRKRPWTKERKKVQVIREIKKDRERRGCGTRKSANQKKAENGHPKKKCKNKINNSVKKKGGENTQRS